MAGPLVEFERIYDMTDDKDPRNRDPIWIDPADVMIVRPYGWTWGTNVEATMIDMRPSSQSPAASLLVKGNAAEVVARIQAGRRPYEVSGVISRRRRRYW